MAGLACARLFHKVARPIPTTRKTFSDPLRPRARTTFPAVRSNSHSRIIRAHFHRSHFAKTHQPRIPPEAPAQQPIPISGSDLGHGLKTTHPKPSTAPTLLVLVLRRTALAYLLSISLCLAWTGVSGWYLVLNGRGDEVDERSPLRIVWDATRWPVDAVRGSWLFKEED